MKRNPWKMFSGACLVVSVCLVAGMALHVHMLTAQEPPKPLPLAAVKDDGEASYVEFPPRRGHYYVVPLRIIDGDTVEYGVVIRESRGRINGINAPEKNTPAGVKAKAHMEAILPVGKITEATLHGPDKYGGTMIDFKGKEGYWVAKTMTDSGHAARWDGQGPKPLPPENK